MVKSLEWFEEIPHSKIPWLREFFQYLTQRPINEEKFKFWTQWGKKEPFEAFGAIIIPDTFQTREEFQWAQQFFTERSHECIFQEDIKDRRIVVGYIFFFWMVDLFPDTQFVQELKEKAREFLKLVLRDKNTNYFEKRGNIENWIASKHIDSFLPTVPLVEKYIFADYLKYRGCFGENPDFRWQPVDQTFSLWKDGKKAFLGVIGPLAETFLEKLEKKSKQQISQIFISHLAYEKEAAMWMKETFKKVFGASIQVFCASDRESIPPGEEWYRWITENIFSSNIVVILISPRSQNRPWINFEAGMARGALKKVIPVVYLGAESTGIGFPLSGLQAIMLREPSDFKQIFDVCESNLNVKCPDMKWDDLFRDFKKLMDEISTQSSETESQNNQTMHQQTFDELAEEYSQLIHNLSKKRDDTIFSKIEALVSKMLARAKNIPKRKHNKILNIIGEYRNLPAQILHITPMLMNKLGEILVIIGPYVDR